MIAKTKKVQLKNIETIVPANAEIVTDFSSLKENDVILKVWDNPKFLGTPMEINNRLLALVKTSSSEEITFTGDPFNNDFTRIAKDHMNATTCSFGMVYKSSTSIEKNFPQVIFKLS